MLQPIRIAHISDLHFGAAFQESTWQAVKAHLQSLEDVQLLLVTGDIVDSPGVEVFEKAKEELNSLCHGMPHLKEPQFLVCPGNHDRHRLGVAIPKQMRRSTKEAKFNEDLVGHIPTIAQSIPVKLVHRSNDPMDEQLEWDIRVFGLDSAASSDVTARGLVGAEDIRDISTRTTDDTGQTPHFRILLIHHHVLPVRSLEAARQNSRKDLLSLTTLVNAGSFVEQLALSNIDMVLHGHEHAANWSIYRTLEGSGGQVCILGAASATGTITGDPCSVNNMSYNLIELNPDRSVSLSVWRYQWPAKASAASGYTERGEWKEEKRLEVFDAPAIRRSRFLRRTQTTMPPNSELIKFIEFTPERNGWVRDSRTNWMIAEERWTHECQNSTGLPVELDLCFQGQDTGQLYLPENLKFFPSNREDHTWEYSCVPPAWVRKEPQRIEISYRWWAGAVLTSQDLEALPLPLRGDFRRDGLEFAAATVTSAVASLTLVVAIPPQFAPDWDNVHAYASHPDENRGIPSQQPDIACRKLSKGVFSLVVPYPRHGATYAIAWTPPPAIESRESRLLRELCARDRAKGDELAKNFYDELNSSPLKDHCSVSLYLPRFGQPITEFELAGHFADGGAQPQNNIVGTANSMVTRAWWGVPEVAVRDEDEDQILIPYRGEMLPHENAVIALPLRRGLMWVNGPVWAVVRVGINFAQHSARDFVASPELTTLLLKAMISLVVKTGI